MLLGRCSQRGNGCLGPAFQLPLHALSAVLSHLLTLCPACAVLEYSMARDVCSCNLRFAVTNGLVRQRHTNELQTVCTCINAESVL